MDSTSRNNMEIIGGVEAVQREAPCRHCGSDWHYSDECVAQTVCVVCGVPLPDDAAAVAHLGEALLVERVARPVDE